MSRLTTTLLLSLCSLKYYDTCDKFETACKHFFPCPMLAHLNFSPCFFFVFRPRLSKRGQCCYRSCRAEPSQIMKHHVEINLTKVYMPLQLHLVEKFHRHLACF